MVSGISIKGTPPMILTRAHMAVAFSFTPANENGARDNRTVTVRRKLEKSGIEVRVKVPVSEFYGVAVLTEISEDGELTSAVELVHADPGLTYRVFEEIGNHAVVAEWQNWGKTLRLPLYIRAGNGELIPYSQQVGGLMVGEQHGRRMLSAEAERRTRFARRRKTGSDIL